MEHAFQYYFKQDLNHRKKQFIRCEQGKNSHKLKKKIIHEKELIEKDRHNNDQLGDCKCIDHSDTSCRGVLYDPSTRIECLHQFLVEDLPPRRISKNSSASKRFTKLMTFLRYFKYNKLD